MMPGYVVADAGRRIGGYIIDWIVAAVLVAVVKFGTIFSMAFLVISVTDEDGYTKPISSMVDTFTTGLSYVVVATYFVSCWMFVGRTLGQAAAGIHVVERQYPAIGGIRGGAAVARLMGYAICTVIPFGIGFFLGWHDKIANTEAIIEQRYVPPQGAYYVPPPMYPQQLPPPTPTQPSPPAVAQRRFCEHCGESLRLTSRYCPRCGEPAAR
jgi:RDD family